MQMQMRLRSEEMSKMNGQYEIASNQIKSNDINTKYT